MRVFISWSGPLSHQVACALRDWLPSVIQAIKPYVSSQDIDKGTRWSTDIAKELEASTYGIICLTPDNLDSPWIHFEAGALSRSIDKSFVSPLLFRVKRSEVQGPLLQFQSTVIDREDVLKLVRSVNSRIPENERLRDELLEKAFTVWWPQLEKSLSVLSIEPEGPAAKAKSEKHAHTPILEELLELARQQQRLLSSPERLIPRDYFDYLFHHASRETRRSSRLSASVHERIVTLEASLARLCARYPEALEAREVLAHVHGMLHDEMDDVRRDRPLRTRILPSAEDKGATGA